jgi:hypothetical protein
VAKKKARADGCTLTRTYKVTHGTFDLARGVDVSGGREEWITGPCGVPLFTDAERASGRCRSCASGWTHPENYPAGSAPPKEA